MSELFTNLYNAYFTLRGSDKYIIGKNLRMVSLSENAYLLHLDKRDVTYLNWFYGNPTCGLISEDETWAVMAGNFEITVWNEGVVSTIDINPVFDIRQKDPHTVELLVGIQFLDPAVWELNVHTMELEMVGAYTSYFNKEYIAKCSIVGPLMLDTAALKMI